MTATVLRLPNVRHIRPETITRMGASSHGVGRTTPRSVRLSDEIWGAVLERAKDDGVTTSEVVRRALIRYTELPEDTTGVYGRADREGKP